MCTVKKCSVIVHADVVEEDVCVCVRACVCACGSEWGR